MKNQLSSILVCGLTVLGAPKSLSAEYVVDMPGSVTIESLSQTPESGVENLGDGVFAINDDITITTPATFDITGAKVLKMADNVTIRLSCYCNLDAGDDRVLVTRADATAAPRGIWVDYSSTSEDVIIVSALDFEYASLKFGDPHAYEIKNCTFSNSNGKLSSMAALSLGSTGGVYTISGCTFTDNTVPAIGCAANYACGLTVSDCTFINNNTSNTNKPQINITVGGDLPVTIERCSLTGTGLNMVGGIAVGNLTMLPGANEVTIKDCDIREHRYGITGIGPMKMYIRDNMLYNNSHETNAMNGGSGISLAGYGYQLDAVVSGNHIEKSLWGVTVINCNDVNLGQVGNVDSPGNNVLVDNGNGGVAYDLYNNSAKTVYAQNNTWSVPEQTAELIETVIFHNADNPALGEVIYMPAHESAGLSEIKDCGMRIDGNKLVSAEPVNIYDITGRVVKASAHNPCLDTLAPGEYIAKTRTSTMKILVK